MIIHSCRKCGAVEQRQPVVAPCGCGVRDWQAFIPFDQDQELIYRLVLDGVVTYDYDKTLSSAAMVVDCSDLFEKGAPDMSYIFKPEYEGLRECIQQCENDSVYGLILHLCRKRGARPHGEAYLQIPQRLWYLYNNAARVWLVS